VQEPDVWEKGRHVIDLQLSKTFKERLTIKLNVRDMLAQKLIFYQNIDENGKKDLSYNKEFDNTWQETTFGQSFSLGVSFKF
jgi:hypothetical protein